MSTTIDQRIVEMKFDNHNFENNVQDSLNTIDRLQQSLKFTGATKGLEDINAASKNVNMGGLGDAVETVKLKFDALQVMAVTALSNITNQAVNAGKRIVSALTLDPIKTGFTEYETKINAVQTILANTASKGTTMSDVTKALDELNEYADKTIYNFAEMTRNIGTFTAAGVGLEEATSAIQGIANLAAASGANSQAASRAMYQMSQALSAGRVMTRDWMSLEQAGMAGEKIQNALKQTAKEYGVEVDEIIEQHGSFRESLSEGWVSAEIFNTTLKKFTVEGAKEYADAMLKSGKYTKKQAEALIEEAKVMEGAATEVKTFTQLFDTLKEAAQSGWSKTWELILGDFEEAKETFSSIHKVLENVINGMSDARNNLIQGWRDLGGRADIVDSLFNIMNGISSIVKPIKEAFAEVFPPLTVETLKKFTQGLKDLTAKFKLGDKASENLKRTFKGLFSIVELARHVIFEVLRGVGLMSGNVLDLGGGILEVTAVIGDWITRLVEAVKKSGTLRQVIDLLVKGVDLLALGLKAAAGFIAGTFSFVGDAASTAGAGVVSAIETMGAKLEGSGLIGIFKGLVAGLETILTSLFSAIGTLGEKLGEGLNAVGINSVFDLLNALITGGLGLALINFVKTLSDGFGNFIERGSLVQDTFEEFKGVLAGYQATLKADALLKLAAAIAILVASVVVVSTIDSKKLFQAVLAIGALFALLTNSFTKINKSTRGMARFVKSTVMLTAMATSVLILAIALKHIADLDFGSLVKGVIGVSALMGIMLATFKTLKGNGKTVIVGAGQMTIMAGAILVLTLSLKAIASLNWEQLAIGLTGLSVVVAEFMMIAKMMKTDLKEIVAGGFQMLLLASSVAIMAASLKSMASFSWGEILRGITGLTASVAALMVLANSMKVKTGEPMVKGAGKIVLMASAIAIMAGAMKLLASVSWGGLLKGITGASVAVGLIIGMAAALKKIQADVAMGSTALILMGVALGVFAVSLMLFEHISWETLVKGITTLAVALGTLLLAGVGLALLAHYGAIAVGAIAALAASALMLGIALGVIGIGIELAAVGLSGLINTLGAVGGQIATIAIGIAETASAFVKGIAVGIIGACEVIAKNAPVVGKAIEALIVEACSVVRRCIPEIVKTFLVMIDDTLDELNTYAPAIVDKLLTFVITIIDQLAEKIPELSSSLGKLLSAVVDGIKVAIGDLDPKSLLDLVTAMGIVVVLIKTLKNLSPTAILAATKGLITVGIFLAELTLVLAAIGVIAQIPGLNWLVNKGGDLLEAVGKAIGKFVGGIAGGVAEGVSASLPRVGTNLSAFMTNLKPFVEGVNNIKASTLKGVGIITGAIVALTAASVLSGIGAFLTGGVSLVGFATQLPALGVGIALFSKSVEDVKEKTLTVAASAFEKLAKISNSMPGFMGFMDAIIGIKSPAVFGAQLPVLGEGIALFSKSVEDVQEDKIEAATSAFSSLAKASHDIPAIAGIAQGFAGQKSMQLFGSELALLGKGIASFSKSVEDIKKEPVDTAVSAIGSLAPMYDHMPRLNGIWQALSGSKLASFFALELLALGHGILAFSNCVDGINVAAVESGTTAASSLAKLYDSMPKLFGMANYFTGSKLISVFAVELVALGIGISQFAKSVENVTEAMIKPGVDAAISLAGLYDYAPKVAGLADIFHGVKSLSAFGAEIFWLGKGIADFAKSVSGITDDTSIKIAVEAASGLAPLYQYMPDLLGLSQLFTGFKSMKQFGWDLNELGTGISLFYISTIGIRDDKSIKIAVEAAKSLAPLYDHMPKILGLANILNGTQSLSAFGLELPELGKGIANFCGEINGAEIDNAKVTAATEAAKTLAEMTEFIPNEGGIKSWFTGETAFATFSGILPELGKNIAGFANSIGDIVPENVKAAAEAGKTLAQMTTYIPNEKGVRSWFVGETAFTTFADKLPTFGTHLSSFANAVGDINPENVKAAAEAGKILAEMTKIIPNEGGIESWFTGESAFVTFADKLPNLGTNLAAFAVAVKDIAPESVKAAAEAGKILAEMTQIIPNEGGVKSWFTGDSAFVTFADKLPDLGSGIADFANSVGGIVPENVTAAATAAKTLAEMTKVVPDNTDKIIGFGTNLSTFATSLVSYFTTTSGIGEDAVAMSDKIVKAVNKVAGIKSDSIGSAATALNTLVEAMKNVATVSADSADGLAASLSEIAKMNIDSFADKFSELNTKLGEIGKSIMDKFVSAVKGENDKVEAAGGDSAVAFSSGITGKELVATIAVRTVVEACLATIKTYNVNFVSAGAQIATGFANGMASMTFFAALKARALAAAAKLAMEDELLIKSPSRVAYWIGGFFGEGFVIALSDYAAKSYAAGSDIASSAKDGLNSAIGKINDLISSDIESQPTIRPVLDLSNVKAGAGAIGELLATGPALNVKAQLGSISSAMSSRAQNGTTNDVISAIDKLRKDLSNVGNTTYTINGVTYDDGSNVADAVGALIRAAKIERRM